MTDFHKNFPKSGVGKEYPWILYQLEYVQRQYDTPIRVLDYGAGKGGTTQWLKSLGFDVVAYDPYWEPNSDTRRLEQVYDAIISGDVLEHIETEDIPWRKFKTAKHNIHIIDLTPAKKTLPDGRNAHINLQTEDEWHQTFYKHLGGKLKQYCTYLEADPTYEWRTRLCIHIEQE